MEGRPALEECSSPHSRPRTALQDADRLKELRYNTTKVERHLKQLVKSGEELQKARDDMYVKEQQWVMDMVDFNLHHDVRYLSLSLSENGSAEKHPAAILATTLKDLAKQMYTLNKEVQEMVLQPMKQFLQVEVNGSVEMQKKLDLARERYQTASTKFSGVSHKTDMGHFTKWENEVAESKQEYDLIYFNGITKMMEVERNKIHLVHSYFHNFFMAYQKFYEKTGLSLKTIMPEMQVWKEAIEEGRKKAKEQAAENDDMMLDHVSKLQQSGYKSTEALELLSPRVNLYGSPVQPDKQGYLFLKKAIKTTKGWKCCWFVQERGILMYYKNIKSTTPDGGLNLLLCTVKEMPEKNLCFQVISTEDRYMLRATNEVEYAEWLEALRNGIASQLANGCESPTDSKKGMASRALAQELWVVNGNSKCADCGQKDPEWAVLNLGILICVKCSGIHRSLGVHISKVRSLELDKWEPQQLGLMKAIGNALANSLWEADVPEAWAAKRPDPESDGKIREYWIKSKYVEKNFIKKATLSSEEIGKSLRRAALENNFAAVVECLLWGADINWLDPADDQGTAVHALTRTSGSDAAMLELLLQNGGETTILDDRKRNPLHYAVESNRPDLCKILRSRGASLTVADRDGQTPLDIAEAKELDACITILKEEKRDEPQQSKSSITSIGSTGLGGGLTSSQSAEDMSKALRGSLNLLSEGGFSMTSRKESKDRQRAPTANPKQPKPRLITKLKDQVIGRKKSFTVSEPRQPGLLVQKERGEEMGSPLLSSRGTDGATDLSIEASEEEEDPSMNESGGRSFGEDSDVGSSPRVEERRPLSARRHTQAVTPPPLDKAASMSYFQRAQRSGSSASSEEAASTQQAEEEGEGEGGSGIGSSVRYIPRGTVNRRRKSTDLTPIVLGRARERSKDGSEGDAPDIGRTSGSLIVRPSQSPLSEDETDAAGRGETGESGTQKGSWIASSSTSGNAVPTAEWTKSASSPTMTRSMTVMVGTPNNRQMLMGDRGSPYSSAGSSPSGSPSSSSVTLTPPTERGRRKSDAAATHSPDAVGRDGRRKKSKDSTSPSTSPSSPDPSGAASMTKKLRSLRHSFGRRDQQELLRDSAWSSTEGHQSQGHGGKSTL